MDCRRRLGNLYCAIACPGCARFLRWCRNDHVQREALQALLERELGPEAKEAIVTTGKQLIEQGRQEGLREGLRQGECAVLLRQLRRRFGSAVTTDIEQRIATASIEQINIWAERVLSAPTLTELLADGA